MAGIYIHIPFCNRICYYCDFYKTANFKLKDNFLAALLKEIKLRAPFLKGQPIETIYFGGGTPSVLKWYEIKQIMNEIKQHFDLSKLQEVTLEANPDDLSEYYLAEVRKQGINRLSIGIQSFDDAMLKKLNRRHTAKQAIDCLSYAKNAGFDNVSIDLIYGLPDQNLEQWNKQLEIMKTLPFQHLSAYHLTYEPKTVMHMQLSKGYVKAIDEEVSLELFKQLLITTKELGIEQYEISNFSLPGFQSKHNSSYWNLVPYLGLGPSAHSFDGSSRYWNISNVDTYINKLAEGKPQMQSELLSKADMFNEYVMTSFRTTSGINLSYVAERFGETYLKDLLAAVDPFVQNKKVDRVGECLRATVEGYFISDKIISDLFYIE